ncbi:hypothetical protein EDC44_12835 [Cricetibacter osteomyelitidis]|uniref:Uncharacterized protein n=2 Tax=Cricetibacter osteomyelitidis TaxID=1521931 RepID=A0A4R2TBC9_9PAST|nr:hypothetical protein EDC44_12835 [Cricetibacter osteomyelitidis]
MFHRICIAFSVILLSNCVVTLDYTRHSDVSSIQKRNTLGYTDTEQRWKDILSCGGVRTKDGNFFYILFYDEERKKYKDAFSKDRIISTSLDDLNYHFAFNKCMEDKNYIFIEEHECKKSKVCNE